MLVAVRTEAPTRLRQEKRREKFVSLKIFACGYRLRATKTQCFFVEGQGEGAMRTLR
jgi:hypothetical protein